MPNTYFQFKQFTVHQEKCAMKVCTDACLFGGWVADYIGHKEIKPANILDIGAGTGLLSLMIAQATNANIDAVELDEAAAKQAQENIESSPWHERIGVLQGDVRRIELTKKYGFIVSNPPFFENDLKSPDQQRNLALHSSELGLDELLSILQKYLSPNGVFAVLLPWHRRDAFVQLATTQGFFLSAETAVKQTPAHSNFRAMLLFEWQPCETKQDEIIIRDHNIYTEPFSRLLKEYYLHL